ncbi:MAG: DUF2891 domain-containing protein [Maricaulaceae bacterium]|nr:DUF2891 domain-containing protein [Maricaulaceae bacterium]
MNGTVTRILAAAACTAALAGPAQAQEEAMLDTGHVARFAQMALDCVHREYPNKISHVLNSDADARPPRELTPVFYGCFDWHSAVHGHWLLARLARLHPEADFTPAARAALAQNFTAENVAGELEYFAGEGRASFERPYGLAWFLQLTAELREWDDPQARDWAQTLAPLEDVVEARFMSWLPNLVYPVRSGTHNQTAFGFALALDWARIAGRGALAELLTAKSLAFHVNDRTCPLDYEPSGEDFLSPCLMQADLMRRVIPAAEYPAWLSAFLPGIPEDGSAGWIAPGVVLDPTDGKLVHLDGFNLSRAWNLQGIAASLPADDPRRAALLAAEAEHREAGLAAVSDAHYEGGHWLASFATYLVTGKALEARGP